MQRLSIYKRKDGRYEGRVYIGHSVEGSRRYRSYYGKDENEVLQKYAAEQESSLFSDVTDMTVKELVMEWRSAVMHRIKASTAANYSMKISKHIIPYFGEMNIGTLKSRDVHTFINKKLSDGLSPRYISDIVVLLKSLLKYAMREYGINNVSDGIIMPKKTKSDVCLLDESEQEMLKKYIDRSRDATSLGAAFSLYSLLSITSNAEYL